MSPSHPYIVQQHKFVIKSESHCQILAPTHKCSHVKILMLLVKILYYFNLVDILTWQISYLFTAIFRVRVKLVVNSSVQDGTDLCACKQPYIYVLQPISQKCSQHCLWNSCSVCLIDIGPFLSFQGRSISKLVFYIQGKISKQIQTDHIIITYL